MILEYNVLKWSVIQFIFVVKKGTNTDNETMLYENGLIDSKCILIQGKNITIFLFRQNMS